MLYRLCKAENGRLGQEQKSYCPLSQKGEFIWSLLPDCHKRRHVRSARYDLELFPAVHPPSADMETG